MRILIAYAGRTGTTEKAARMLAAYFEDADLRDLRRDHPIPSKYDAVVVGSCVRSGKIEPAVRKFLIRHERELDEKKVGIFICNAFLDQVPSIIEKNFPELLVEQCVSVDSFGGEVDYSKLGFFEKLEANMSLKRLKEQGSVVLPCLLTDRIKVFADKIRTA